MQITPLVRHAAMRLPALTDLFSDRLPVSLLDVAVAGGLSRIVCSSPHGLAVGGKTGLCISQMEVPNPVVAVDEIAGKPDFYLVETRYQHDIAKQESVHLTGFTDAKLNGQLELEAVRSDFQFEIVAGGISPPVLTGQERLLEPLDYGVTGWHVVTAVSETEFEFTSPPAVSHAFQVENPVVLTNIRIWGALTYEGARRAYIRMNENGTPEVLNERPGLFIVPNPLVGMAKSRDAGIGIIQEVNSGTDFRARMLDEVDIFAFFPATGNDVAVADDVQGPLLAAMLKTFYGLRLPRPHLSGCPEEHMMMVLNQHRSIEHNGAVYVHGYEFQAPVLIRNEDVIQADEYPDFAPEGESLQPVGSRALRNIRFDLGKNEPGVPLTAEIVLE